MTNFTVAKDPYHLVIPILLCGPGFQASGEYALIVESGGELPGVVAAAFAKYVRRALSDEALCRSLIMALNVLAAWHDRHIDTLLEGEVIEQFWADGVLEKVEGMFGDDLVRIVAAFRSRRR